MSISSCFNKTVLSGLFIYIIIFRNAHMFLIDSQLGVHTDHTLKGQTAGKGKNKLYKTIESK
jgi:hypothetical protein